MLTFTDPLLDKIVRHEKLESLLNQNAVPFYVRALKEDERVTKETLRALGKAAATGAIDKLGDALFTKDDLARPLHRALRREARGGVETVVQSAFYGIYKDRTPFRPVRE